MDKKTKPNPWASRTTPGETTQSTLTYAPNLAPTHQSTQQRTVYARMHFVQGTWRAPPSPQRKMQTIQPQTTLRRFDIEPHTTNIQPPGYTMESP